MNSFVGFREIEYPLCEESNSQDVVEDEPKSVSSLHDISSQTKTIVTSVISVSGGETKISVKLKRWKG